MKATDLPIHYNAIDILERNLLKRRHKIALYSLERTLSFQQIAAEVNQIGNALKEIGVRYGEFVAILAPDCAEWITTFFGALKIGAVGVCLNTMLEAHEYEHIFCDCRARVLIVHETLLPIIEPIRANLHFLQQVIVIGTPQRCSDLAFLTWIAEQPTTLAAESTHRDDYCALFYSSGTTGLPKGICHAHKDLALTAQLTGVDLFGLKESDRTFSVAKLFFVYGMGGNLIFPWFVGASIVLYAGSSRMSSNIRKLISDFQPTVLYAVPAAYGALLASTNIHNPCNVSSLHTCISAGEALPLSIWERWKEQTGLEILDTVGCTESFHTFLANRPNDLRPGSSGKPSPGYEVKLVDDEGNEVPAGMIGDLLLKGESIALSYRHEYTKSRHTFRGEWFFTGDKFYVDEDGFYWHVGRVDDMLKVGGLWVSPIEVENTLRTHPAVLECAVVGESDASTLIKPKAYVCLHPEHSPGIELKQQLLLYCVEELADYKRPRWIEFVDTLPRTATGKIQRYRLRR